MQFNLLSQYREKNEAIEIVKDPVCGMEVNPAKAYHTEFGGKVYYFCGAGCKASFKRAHFNKANVNVPKQS